MMRIGLGTVQFGVPYGITNTEGQVPAAAVKAILDQARSAGLRILDTAALYGDSEQAIGTAGGAGFDIVTKTSKAAGLTSADAVSALIQETFELSLARLGRSSVYGLIAHEADDLLGPFGKAVWARMERLKAAGRVQKIGASVYTGQQIDRLVERFPLDLVQLPFNAVDRRLVEAGQLGRLSARGVEIHARSAFLQGLLLSPPERIAARFGPLARSVRGLHALFAERGLTPLEGLLAAVLQRPEIGCVIVGVTSPAEMAGILAAAGRAEAAAADATLDVSPFALADERILSPALWPRLEGAAH